MEHSVGCGGGSKFREYNDRPGLTRLRALSEGTSEDWAGYLLLADQYLSCNAMRYAIPHVLFAIMRACCLLYLNPRQGVRRDTRQNRTVVVMGS